MCCADQKQYHEGKGMKSGVTDDSCCKLNQMFPADSAHLFRRAVMVLQLPINVAVAACVRRNAGTLSCRVLCLHCVALRVVGREKFIQIA